MHRGALILSCVLAGAVNAPAQSFFFFPQSGVVRSVLGGEDAVPFPGGPPGQDFVVYPDGKTAVAAVGWDALILRKCDVISGHVVNWRVPERVGDWKGFRGPVTISHVDGLLRFGQPDGDVVYIDPDTLRPLNERAKTGRKELVRLVGPAPPPVVADFNPPVTFGTGTRFVFIAFDPTDDTVPPADKAWLCREVYEFFKRLGVELVVSTRRPPLPGPGKAPLAPQQYGTVRVLPSEWWPFGMRVGVAAPGPAAAWNADAVGWKGDGERAVWAWIDKAAYRRQYGREALLSTVCHEICHAVGRLPDLYRPRPDGTWDPGPPGNLMSAGGGGNPLESMELTPQQIRLVQVGAAGWMGGR